MATRIKLKARPVLTLADFAKAAFPRVTTDPVHVSYLVKGQPHGAKLRGKVLAGMYVAIVCPCCGEPTEELHSHPDRPGLMCETCLTLYTEPLATETGPNRITSVREG